MSHADQRFDREGWRYGVRFHDGSVHASWSGQTQRERALEYIAEGYAWLWKRRPDGTFIDHYELVRHRDGEPWQLVV